jgi:rhomboid family GlyGly-CTERM serine protease
VAGGLRLTQGARTWLALAALLGAGSVLAWLMPAAALDWQPARAAAEPWRAASAAFVHWSGAHLLANLAGLAVVAAFGVVAAVTPRCTLAWALAWPLTHAALLLQPGLAHYGGLSGVLHAGVAVAALHVVRRRRGWPRAIGAAIIGGLVLKIVLEAPWASTLVHPRGWNIAVAPLAHAAGAFTGALLHTLLNPRR